MGSGSRPNAAFLTGMVLGAATAADIPDVAALERACYADPWPPSAFASLPDNARVFFHVAREHARSSVAGYVIAWYVLDEGELANLAVAPEHRRRGLGTKLLDAMLSDAAARGVSDVCLEVRDSNAEARRLYGSRGFLEVGRRKGYYRNPLEDALILRRTVGP